jgi:AraC-like DNA-binding protein
LFLQRSSSKPQPHRRFSSIVTGEAGACERGEMVVNNIKLSDIIVKEIQSIYPIRLMKNEARLISNRKRTGLIFAEQGQLVYEMNNERFLSDQNHALLLPYGSTYTIKSIDHSVSLLIDFIAEDYADDQTKIVAFKLSASDMFFMSFHQLDNIWTFKKNAYKLKCMAGLYNLMSKISDMDALSYTPSYKFAQINASIKYLESNYNNPNLTNELLAEQSNISVVYFRKLFTDKYGISPMKYVINKRIEKAQEMLKGNVSTITGIAEAVGFKCNNNFSRSFKNMTGYSPQEYRKYFTYESEFYPD